MGIEIDDEVRLRVIDRGVGGVTETNVNLAAASNAVIIGFNVRAEGKATELANREGVDIRYYSIIYQAIDEVEKALKGMLKPIYEEVELGRAEIRAIFKSSKVATSPVASCSRESSSATPRHVCSATTTWLRRPSRSRRCGVRRTTSSRCAKATNVVSRSPTPTSRSAM